MKNLKKIILVESNPDIRQIWMKLIVDYFFPGQNRDLEILPADNLATARTEIKKKKFHALIIGQIPLEEKVERFIEMNPDFWPRLIICGDQKITNLCDIYGIAALPQGRVIQLADDLEVCKKTIQNLKGQG
ncbi:MAG TPA: hypothetical protein PKI61_02045 [bacterium]|nr:hypothetical protein [bacterium]HPT29646.1 hypothetical protein [bacterium]